MVTLEVSVLGGGFARWAYQGPPIKRGVLAWARVEGEEHPIAVKVRGPSRKPSEGRLLRFEPIPQETKLRLLKNLVRGMIWEEGYREFRIVQVSLDEERGHVHYTYVADRRLQLEEMAPRIAKRLHLRVTFEQIGARDYAQKIGGIGVCGMEVCCKLFLKKIPSVSLDMARRQYLFVAPERLSGICGRLLCCLRYELPVYEELQKRLPRKGESFRLPDGQTGVVHTIRHLQEEVDLQLPDGSVVTYRLDELLTLEKV